MASGKNEIRKLISSVLEEEIQVLNLNFYFFTNNEKEKKTVRSIRGSRRYSIF